MKLLKIPRFMAWLAPLLAIAIPVIGAEPYKIGPEDVLEINFWQDDNLNTQVRVTLDGKITLDIIGEIDAVGLTTVELERSIVRQMGRYNKAISQAVVRVLEYNYQRVFVTGEVTSPGKLTFEEIPDLWTIINVAGGVDETGDLTRVRIVRGGKDAGKVEEVNVSALVAAGKINELPKINRDDTIDIPRTFTGLPSDPLSDTQDRRRVYYVVGSVAHPGVQNLQGSLDLMEAIALAGGPVEAADIKKVSVMSKDRLGSQVTKFNMKEYTLDAYPNRYIVQPEDIIYIPPLPDQRRRTILGLGLTEWVGVLGGIGTFLLLADQLSVINISGDE